ncbi:MAG: hypothetical protein QG553_375 [Patescibacteria group bacterium]|nr:hypothetical protein [Patescibacteria group bacterium]
MPKATPKKPVSKAKTANVSNRKPRLLQVLVGLTVVLVVVFTGTMIYTKMQERDVKAKAAAFSLRAQDYSQGNFPANGVRMAICRKGSSVIGIVTYPHSLNLIRPSDGKKYIALATIIQSDSADIASPGEGTFSRSWLQTNPYMTFIELKNVSNNKWISLSFENTATREKINSKRILAAFIPYC